MSPEAARSLAAALVEAAEPGEDEILARTALDGLMRYAGEAARV